MALGGSGVELRLEVEKLDDYLYTRKIYLGNWRMVSIK